MSKGNPVNVKGVNYWYDNDDKVYKFDRFGYPSVVDDSKVPYKAKREIMKGER